MNLSKMRFIVLGASVISLGIMLGTLLWLKLAPAPGHVIWEQPLEGLNRYGAVPDFSLVERSGKRVNLRDLRGKVWVADFIYTTCKDTCPLQSAEMSKLQDEWGATPDLKLVSFSVDPDRDTPQVLSSYALNFTADANRWLFLTGDKDQISRLIQEGFRLSAAPVTESGSKDQVILHSPRFVLIDKETEIRGYYDSRDGEALGRLKKDVLTLTSGKKE
jgi:protein SCO1